MAWLVAALVAVALASVSGWHRADSSGAPAGAGAADRTTTSAPPESRRPSKADRATLRALVRFARSPTEANWSAVPLADRVELGLADRLVAQRSARELLDPRAWRLEAEPHFRAYVGPFSALELIAGHAGPLVYSVGPHPHCASPPVPPPRRIASLRRLSVRPADRSIDSCLQWFTVDAFVTRAGRIRAITLDLYEP
jgi:hypothetical protein